MRYGRRLVQILVAERGLWAVCIASALLMAAPLLIPFPTFGEKTLRDEVRINLDIAGQTTPSAEDLASMPEDMKELMAESREALSDAGAAEDAGSFYDAVIRRCNAELEMIDKGYLSGDRDADELRLRFAELMRDLDDPDYLGTSLDASALDVISLAPASMPALLALLPSLAIAFLVQRAVGQQRLMGQAADPAIRIVSSSVCSMLCAAAAILLTLVPAAAIALVRNGLGDPGYPVLYSQAGQTIVWSAAGCAAWTAALLVLASCFVAAAASAISLIFGKAFAGPAVLAILALLSGMPQYYLASSPLSGIVPFLPMSYACPSKIVGYAGIFPYMDLADSVALSPAFGCLVLAVGAAICVICAVVLDAAMRWHRAARLAPQGA